MMRSLWVMLVLGTLMSALIGTRHFRPNRAEQVTDELLAYAIDSSNSVTVNVPAGVDLALLTAWLLVPPQSNHHPEQAFEGTLSVTQTPASGDGVRHKRYAVNTRATTGPTAPDGAKRTVHQLADGPQWVCDPRTVEVDLTSLAGRGGQLQVGMAPNSAAPALLRLSYRFARQTTELELKEAGLSRSEARQLVERAAALGFVDLPADAKRQVLASWGRRLTAVGRVGIDYHRRRLLLGPPQKGLYRQFTQAGTFQTNHLTSAALNLTSAPRLLLESTPGAKLSIVEGARPARVVEMDATGRAMVDLNGRGLHTIVLGSQQPVPVRASVPGTEPLAQFGDVERVVRDDGRVSVAPDIRTQSYYALAELSPIAFATLPNQGALRVRIRGRWPPTRPPGARIAATVWATLSGPAMSPQKVPLQVTLERSQFAYFDDGTPATETAVAHLFAPDSATSVALTGDDSLAVSVGVAEPGVEQSVAADAYAAELRPDQILRNAPLKASRWASIRPQNIEAVHANGRRRALHTQVRIEPGPPPPAPLPEQAIYPLGYPPRRTLLVNQQAASPQQPDKRKWFAVPSDGYVRVPESGPSTGQLRIRYRTQTTELGQPLAVSLDGRLEHQTTLRLTSGTIALRAPPGRHQLEISGLGARGKAEVDYAPNRRSQGQRRYGLHRLTVGKPLTFPIRQRPGTPAFVVLVVATEGTTRPVAVRYQLDGGLPKRRSSLFVQHATQASGTLQGLSGDAGSGQWESLIDAADGTQLAVAGLTKLKLRLGDDLKSTQHRLTLNIDNSVASVDRLWVRAVVVGQPVRRPAADHRLFVGDRP